MRRRAPVFDWNQQIYYLLRPGVFLSVVIAEQGRASLSYLIPLRNSFCRVE